MTSLYRRLKVKQCGHDGVTVCLRSVALHVTQPWTGILKCPPRQPLSHLWCYTHAYLDAFVSILMKASKWKILLIQDRQQLHTYVIEMTADSEMKILR